MIINSVVFSFLTQQAFKMIAFTPKLMCIENFCSRESTLMETKKEVIVKDILDIASSVGCFFSILLLWPRIPHCLFILYNGWGSPHRTEQTMFLWLGGGGRRRTIFTWCLRQSVKTLVHRRQGSCGKQADLGNGDTEDTGGIVQNIYCIPVSPSE